MPSVLMTEELASVRNVDDGVVPMKGVFNRKFPGKVSATMREYEVIGEMTVQPVRAICCSGDDVPSD